MGKAKRKNDYEHIYPNDEEIREKGKAVSWKKVMSSCGFQTHAELALALMTSIGALRDECARQDLAKLLHANIKKVSFVLVRTIFQIFISLVW